MMIKDYFKSCIFNTFYFLAYIVPLYIIGLVVVPIALLFPNESKKIGTYRTNGTDEWWLKTLPRWASLWDNPIDGFLGDDAYRWAGRDITLGYHDESLLARMVRKVFHDFTIKNTDYLGQLLWALRNPVNNFKRFILTCKVTECEYQLLAGQEFVRDDMKNQGWHFLKAIRISDGKVYYRFYYVKSYGKSARAFTAEFGFKFDAQDFSAIYTDERKFKAYKGFTFLVNPYKDIG